MAKPRALTILPVVKKGMQAPSDPETSSENDEKRVSVVIRVTPAERKELRLMAMEADTTVQRLVEDLIQGVLEKDRKAK